ncbi:hypothetical protein APHCR_0198 [Anaplasma phagocytophilum str. CR1007]|uniref:Uncharacterized protein n=1 Tax=Anaplasma phagocytophilum str. NCH-1 TaxID=1359161 RepID=A0A0F3N796_ANAPH|nr:hypothetical protein EPHNCH_0998 [Anaplasma phagocytophilum str. NCH-1]KJZ98992.1 hypothetical protein APHCR_0198 [Anaplasma phagocytophilum str. CR1007]
MGKGIGTLVMLDKYALCRAFQSALSMLVPMRYYEKNADSHAYGAILKL